MKYFYTLKLSYPQIDVKKKLNKINGAMIILWKY